MEALLVGIALGGIAPLVIMPIVMLVPVGIAIFVIIPLLIIEKLISMVWSKWK
jgi:hypothetical protein